MSWLRELFKKVPRQFTLAALRTFVHAHRYPLIICGIVTSIGLTFFVGINMYGSRRTLFALVDQYEARTMDARFMTRGQRPVDPRIAIIAIDQATINKLGYPFPRSWHARMLQRVCEAGARVVGFDVDFPFPDRNSPARAIDELVKQMESVGEKPDPAVIERMRKAAVDADSDAQFAKAMEACGNVVLGHVFFDDAREQKGLDPQLVKEYNEVLAFQSYPQIRPSKAGQEVHYFVAHPDHPEAQFDAAGVEPNLRIFADAAKSAGFMNGYAGADGIFRRSPLVMRYPDVDNADPHQEDFFPSLAVEVTALYLNAGPDNTILYFDENGPSTLELANKTVFPDISGEVLVNFAGPAQVPGGYPHYSLIDVVDGKIPPAEFKDKILYVGATAAGVVSDVRPTPYQKQGYPGVEIHANVTDNILNNAFLTRGFIEERIDLIVLLLCGLVMGLVFVTMKPSWSWAALLVAAAVLLSFAYFEFTVSLRWISVVIPSFVLIANYVGVTSYRVIFEEREKRKVRTAFNQYVHPGLIGQMMKNPELLRLGGEEVVMTVMFSDVRGFTTLSEKLTPTELVNLLNDYLTAMSDIIMGHWGTVDKYEGDAIMAFWGRPYPSEDHATRACRACLAMLVRLKELNRRWVGEGRQELDIGIGLNTGRMVVGNMGSKKRFNYTVMGDSVNLGSRLEGQNKEYGTRIIISESTYTDVKNEYVCRELDLIRVKGKLKPVAIYELMDEAANAAQYDPLVTVFAQGLAAYRAGRFEEALATFQEILAGYPHDGPAKLFARRSQAYITAPPAKWDGVFVATSK